MQSANISKWCKTNSANMLSVYNLRNSQATLSDMCLERGGNFYLFVQSILSPDFYYILLFHTPAPFGEKGMPTSQWSGVTPSLVEPGCFFDCSLCASLWQLLSCTCCRMCVHACTCSTINSVWRHCKHSPARHRQPALAMVTALFCLLASGACCLFLFGLRTLQPIKQNCHGN